MARCQRYYQKFIETEAATGGVSRANLGDGLWYQAPQVLGTLLYTTKRANPAISSSGADALKCYVAGGALSANDATPCDMIRCGAARFNIYGFAGGSTGTAGQGTHIILNANEYIEINAELL